MLKFKYSFIAFLNSAFSALAIIILYLDFNVESITSIFLFALSYFQIVQFICQLFSEHFIFAYLSIDSQKDAHLFYSSYLFLSIILSLFIWTLVLGNIGFLINLFNAGLNDIEKGELKSFILSLAPYIFIFLPGTLSQAFFTAKKKIIYSYLNQILPSSSLFLGFIIRKIFDLDLLFVSYFYSLFSSFAIIAIILYSKPKLYFSFRIFITQIIPTLKESFQFRAAYNINNIGILLILNIFLSPIDPSLRSSFFLAKKAADTSLQIFFGPTLRILKFNFGKARIKKYFNEGLKLIKKLNIYSPLVFLSIFIFSFLLIPFLKITELNSNNLLFLYSTFFILNLQNIFSTIGMPWIIICQSQQDLKTILLASLLGTCFFYFSNLILFNLGTNLSVSICLFLQEVITCYIVTKKGKIIIKSLIKNQEK